MSSRRDVAQIGGIRRIKKIREDKALKEMIKARSEVERRQVELDQNKQALDDFKRTKDERSNNLFKGIQGKAVSVKEIQRYRGAVASLEEEQQQLSHTVDESRTQVSEAERGLSVARDSHQVSARNHQKMQEVHATLQENFRVGQMKAEERSQEDDYFYRGRKY